MRREDFLSIALTHEWWVDWRDCEPFRKAITMAHAQHWVGIAESTIARNRANGHEPANWSKLALLLGLDVSAFRH